MDTYFERLTSSLGKLFTSRTKRSLDYLDITESQYALARKLKSRTQRGEFAKETLNVSSSDLTIVRNIRRLGLKKFALGVLGINESQLSEYFSYSGKTKLEKLYDLVSDDESIRGFFNRVYLAYRRHKKRQKAAWKRTAYRSHLLKAKQLLETCLENDAISPEQAEEICMRVFMGQWVDKNGQKSAAQAAA